MRRKTEGLANAFFLRPGNSCQRPIVDRMPDDNSPPPLASGFNGPRPLPAGVLLFCRRAPSAAAADALQGAFQPPIRIEDVGLRLLGSRLGCIWSRWVVGQVALARLAMTDRRSRNDRRGLLLGPRRWRLCALRVARGACKKSADESERGDGGTHDVLPHRLNLAPGLAHREYGRLPRQINA